MALNDNLTKEEKRDIRKPLPELTEDVRRLPRLDQQVVDSVIAAMEGEGDDDAPRQTVQLAKRLYGRNKKAAARAIFMATRFVE